MTQPTRYCEQCGAPLNLAARFCGQCGAPIQAAAAPPPAPPPAYQPPPTPTPQPYPAPAVATEAVIAVIGNFIRKKGFLGMGMDPVHLVLTDQRLILAFQTKQMRNQEIDEARNAAKAQGKGWLGQVGAMMGTAGQRYLQAAPEAILREHPENTFVLPAHVRSIKISESHDDESGKADYQLVIDTGGAKIKLHHNGLHVKSARQALRQVFGTAVK